ncbi:partial Phospho-2-dehydro-3-deoxyheptonate aldolase, partial [Gammaproteobacteria bacterium]
MASIIEEPMSLNTTSQSGTWAPASWRERTTLQQPIYTDAAELEHALIKLSQLPPLVTSWEIFRLKELLAEAAAGKRFLLQGGDCAETFDDCSSPLISNRLKVMLQMSLVLVHGLQMPVVRVGRF